MRKQLTFACQPYLHMQAIKDGTVVPEGIDLNFLSMGVEEIFWRQLRHEEFDLSEMSLSSYMMALSRGDDRFIAIPVFPNRIFRHSAVFVNVHKGIEKPTDFIGKTVGLPEYQMTAVTWLRGIFQHEYGVHPNQIHWRSGGQEDPGRLEKLELQLPPDIDYKPIPPDKTLSRMLDSGELDGLFTARIPSCVAAGSPNVRRFFRDILATERDFFRKTSIYPIMHTVAIKRSVYEDNRWIAKSLFKAFLRAKEIVVDNLKGLSGAPLLVILPWATWEAERTREIMGDDWFAYGIEKNRITVDALCQYSFEQGLSARRMSIEELFAPEIFDDFKI
jgi:4,5-dihydroxyphthalate decarboxylase